MALVKLGDKAAGSIVKLKENGVPVEFLVVHQGLPGAAYDASCKGTWLLRKDILLRLAWDDQSIGAYETSSVNSYLNGPYLDTLDENVRNRVIRAKIPYRLKYAGAINSGADGLEVQAFLLSEGEVGLPVYNFGNGSDYAKLDYFISGNSSAANQRRIVYFNGKVEEVWWTRGTGTVGGGDRRAYGIRSNYGDSYAFVCTAKFGIRPALILPSSLLVSDDGTVNTNTAPTTPSSLTVSSQINGGSTVTVEWGTATDAEDNLEGYIVERSLDGGSSWTQIYQGGSRSTTNTVPFGSESVMYRVKAYDSEGLASGWRTSAQVTVINNTAPTVPAGITVPEQVQGGQPLTVSWGPSSDGENNLAGYSLERQVDGGDWAVVYSGPELSFTDAITKGWLTVAYRVRAYDTTNAYSGFAISETRQVNNNTPPAITCEYPGNTPLGVKNEGFEISYFVSDEEGDQIAVTEAVDGAALRTFTAELGAENSFALGGLDWMRLLNGRHTLSITAADGASSTAHTLSFTKEVTKASVTLEQPMSADGPITVCVLAASGFIPADARYTVMVTNNANDGAPVWEDCTAAVRSGANHIFDNSTAEEGFAFNFKLSVERGPSGQGGYITSVQGGFQ